MKVCERNRKSLAWLAVGCLDDAEAEALRAHVGQCAGCRGYLEELTTVAGQLRAAEAARELRPSPFLHRRVTHALREQRRGFGFRWGLLIPVAGLAALVISLFLGQSPAPRVSLPKPTAAAARELAPTILNYQIAANESLDKLDAILAEQAAGFQPPAAVYRAGSLPRNLEVQ
jgi:hypothetical protein